MGVSLTVNILLLLVVQQFLEVPHTADVLHCRKHCYSETVNPIHPIENSLKKQKPCTKV